MFTETAFISVMPGQEAQFLRALRESGIPVLQRADGFHSIQILRGVERPSTFQLTLQWERLEDHTEGFRNGPLFLEWRSIISPFFAEPPQVEHWAPTDET